MTVRERVLAALNQSANATCDDCLAIVAGLRSRQIAYTTCPTLAAEGVIDRDRGLCASCGKFKNVSRIHVGMLLHSAIHESPGQGTATRQWYWEGNIQSSLVTWLRDHGYDVIQQANTATREAGKDIVAISADGEELWVSVKGFPERSAHVQARHWFAGAIFDLVLYRGARTDATLALAFPDGFTTYATLAARTAWLRKSMPFTIYWVSEYGDLRIEQ